MRKLGENIQEVPNQDKIHKRATKIKLIDVPKGKKFL